MHVVILMHARLPAAGYGGTQRVATWLARGLVELGHEVSVICGTGSRVPGARVIEADVKRLADPGLDVAPLVPAGADVLHAHRPLGQAPLPLVVTQHGNAKPGRALPPHTIFLSADHAARHGAVAWVHNGIDPADYHFSRTKQPFDLFLGRLQSVKGYRWAIEGARRSGRALVVAGGWRPSFRRGLRYAGEVDGERKARLLADAACLWMPAQWDEPFGLTLVEALASGTPVLGTRRGALPEIVTPEVGILADTIDELVEARPRLDTISPDTCRDRVLGHLTHRAMGASYLRYYAAACAGEPLPPGRPSRT
jgi:glycosyltransferase involved in cell wall biosynthesis